MDTVTGVPVPLMLRVARMLVSHPPLELGLAVARSYWAAAGERGGVTKPIHHFAGPKRPPWILSVLRAYTSFGGEFARMSRTCDLHAWHWQVYGSATGPQRLRGATMQYDS